MMGFEWYGWRILVVALADEEGAWRRRVRRGEGSEELRVKS